MKFNDGRKQALSKYTAEESVCGTLIMMATYKDP